MRRRVALAVSVGLGLVLLAAGCPGGEPGPDGAPPPGGGAGGVRMRFLALGDSYTIGESVPAKDRWPLQLAARLRAGAPAVEIADPEIVARTGWTTDELDRAIDEAKPRGLYDLVTLLVGVNDQYRGRSLDETRPRFEALVRRAIGFAADEPGRVLVVSVPDWGVTPFCVKGGRDPATVAREIDALNAMEKAVCEAAKVRWLDITPGSRRAAKDATLLAEDGLHPSGTMYAEWAAAAEPLARAALGK